MPKTSMAPTDPLRRRQEEEQLASELASLPDLDPGDDWQQDELARLRKAREKAYSKPRLMPGNQRAERERLDAEIDHLMRSYPDALGLGYPRQWVTGDPNDDLPEWLEPMPAGLKGRQAAEWRADRLAEMERPKTHAVDPEGRVLRADGTPELTVNGEPYKATPRRVGKSIVNRAGDSQPGAWQWQDSQGVMRDENGRALNPDEIDTLATPSFSLRESYLRQEQAALPERLDALAARSMARQAEGLRVDAKEELARLGTNIPDYIPFSPSKLLALAEINMIGRKASAYQAWEERRAAAEAAGQPLPDDDQPPELTRLEKAKLDEFVADQALRREVGQTMGANVASGVANLFPFVAEIAMTGGLAAGARSMTARAAERGVRGVAGRAAAESLGKYTRDKLTGRLVRGVAERMGGASLARVAATPHGFAADYLERRMPSMQVLPEAAPGSGRELQAVSPGQTSGDAAWNTLKSRWIMYGAEEAGEGVAAIGRAGGAKLVGLLPASTAEKLGKSWMGRLYKATRHADAQAQTPRTAGRPGVPGWQGRVRSRGDTMPISRGLRAANIQGYVPELAEEQLEKALNEFLGVDLTPEQRADPLMARFERAMFDAEEAATTMAVLAIPGVLRSGAAVAETARERGQLYKAAQRDRAARHDAMNNVRAAAAAAGVNYDAFEQGNRAAARATAAYIYWRDLAALHPEGSPARLEAAAKADAAAQAALAARQSIQPNIEAMMAEMARMAAPYGGVRDIKPADFKTKGERDRFFGLLYALEQSGVSQEGGQEFGRWMTAQWSPFSDAPQAPAAGPAVGQLGGPAVGQADEDDLSYGDGRAETGQPDGPTAPPPDGPTSNHAERLLAAGSDGTLVDQVVAAGSTAPIQESAAEVEARKQADDAARRATLAQNYARAQAELAVRREKNPKWALATQDIRLMVSFGAQAGHQAMRVYRDLRALGVEVWEAEKEVRRAWPGFMRQRSSVTDGAEIYTLVDAVRDIGGLRSWKVGKEGGAASLQRDYGEQIPLWLRNSTGTPLDQAVALINEMGWSFDSVDAFVEELSRVVGKDLAVERNPVKAQQKAEADEAAAYEQWEQSGSELVPVDRLVVGAEWSAFGERFKVVEVGDTALLVRAIGQRSETWLPFETLSDIRIDKGSLKTPAAAAPVEDDPFDAAIRAQADGEVEDAGASALDAQMAQLEDVSVGMTPEQQEEAVSWAMQAHPGVFRASAHARRSLDKLLSEHPGWSYEQARKGWVQKVQDKAAAPGKPAQSKTPGEGHPGGSPAAAKPKRALVPKKKTILPQPAGAGQQPEKGSAPGASNGAEAGAAPLEKPKSAVAAGEPGAATQAAPAGEAVSQPVAARPDAGTPAPISQGAAPVSAVAGLNAADQARMQEIQAKLRAKINGGGGAVREDQSEYGAGDTRWQSDFVLQGGVGREDARVSLLRLAQDRPVLHNESTGMDARFSRTSVEKLISAQAMRRSVDNGYTALQHNAVASRIGPLFEKSIHLLSRPDRSGDLNVKAIHRFASPVLVDGIDSVAFITVKESTAHGSMLYSVEAVEIKRLAGRLEEAGGTLPAASKTNLSERMAEIKRGVMEVREAPAEYGAGAFGAESATLAAEMAGLYAKAGELTFAGFAAAVRRDMPDVWDGIKRYLHGAWTTAGADNPALEDITRAGAAAALGEIEAGEREAQRRDLHIRRNEGLTDRQRQVADELAEIVQRPAGEVDALFAALTDDNTQGLADTMAGLIVGTDLARYLHPAYRTYEGRIEFTQATGAAASAYAEDLVRRRLANPPKLAGGASPIVIFTAGGVASGKSSILTPEAIRREGPSLVVDAQMRYPDKAVAQVALALQHGWTVQVWYVQRPFALVVDGAIHRAYKSGRWGPLSELPALHMMVQQTLGALGAAYQGNPQVNIRVFHNQQYHDAQGDRIGTIDVISVADVDIGGRLHYDNAVELERIGHERFRNAAQSGKIESRILDLLGTGWEKALSAGLAGRDGGDRQDRAGRNGQPESGAGLPAAGHSEEIPAPPVSDTVRPGAGDQVAPQPAPRPLVPPPAPTKIGLPADAKSGSVNGGKRRSLIPPKKGAPDAPVQRDLFGGDGAQAPAGNRATALPSAEGSAGRDDRGSGAGTGLGLGADAAGADRRGARGLLPKPRISGGTAGVSAGDVEAAGRGGSPAGDDADGAARPGGERGGASLFDRVGTGSAAGGASTGGRGGRGTPASASVDDGLALAPRNFRLTVATMEAMAGRSPLAKAEANVNAIRVLKRVLAAGRHPTDNERETLAGYIGWGHSGIANKMFQPGNATGEFKALADELERLLTPEELATARRSTQYAHYTSAEVAAEMWRAAQRLGFAGGQAFEPGYGVGRFIGLIPDALVNRVRFAGVEMDGVSAQIAQMLYPESGLRHQDLESFPFMADAFDMVIGNPPFSSRVVLSDPRYAEEKMVLHDYFIRKSMDMLKPGGLMILVTSHGTMDKGNDQTRARIAAQADLVGAIRLPQTAFKQDAGTEVVTDILFLRKRAEGAAPAGEAWTGLGEIKIGDQSAWINEYFANHPEMVLGRHSLAGKMRFGGGMEYTVEPGDTPFTVRLSGAVDSLPEFVPATAQDDSPPPESLLPTGADDLSARLSETSGKIDGGFVIGTDGAVYLFDNKAMIPFLPKSERKNAKPGVQAEYVSKDAIKIIKHYIPLRDAYLRVLDAQRNGTDAELQAAQQSMRRAYDFFRSSHGELNQRRTSERTDPETGELTEVYYEPIRQAIKADVYHGAIMALETEDGDGKVKGLSDQFTKRVLGSVREPKVETSEDALAVVLRQTGAPDLAAVARMRGIPVEQAEKELAHRVFRDHDNGKWVVAEKYLSGNVRARLDAAREKAAKDPAYARNVAALEAIQPPPKPISQIKLNLGMHIIPPADIEAFMRDVGGVGVKVAHSMLTGRWRVEAARQLGGGAGNISKFGTRARSAGEILASALNGQPVRVMVADPVTKISHEDKVESTAAQEKVQQLRDAWQAWVWRDPERAERLAKRFNDVFNVYRKIEWNGDHLQFPGLSSRISPYPHQKALPWRVIQTGNTYAAHDVGLGKTMAASLTVMELRRLGMARKPMIVVPNAMLKQWNKDFMEAYPAARLLLADDDAFDVSRRQRFLGRVANSDYDAVVITHSAFKLIPVRPETERAFIQREMDRYEAALNEAKKTEDKKSKTVKEIEKAIESMRDRISALSRNIRRDRGITWDDLGIDFVVVDEAHKFRKLRFATRRRIKGVDGDGSAASWDLYMKTQTIQDRTPGRGLLFLSGTPVVNTMGEIYSVQRYLRPDALATAQVEQFDDWISNFGQEKTTWDKTAGVGYEASTRMSRWVNMTMLAGMWQEFGDYRKFDDLPYMKSRRPDMAGGQIQPMVCTESDVQRDYRMRVLQQRIMAIKQRHGPPQPGDDIMLTVITDGIHAALDERFIKPSLPPNPDSKIERMIADVARIYHENMEDRATQLIFMDKGLPEMQEKRWFSSYLRVKQGLIEAGIPENEVVFFNDWNTMEKKKRLQVLFNEGKIRVMIGNMESMGTGLNVQERLLAVHFATIPWYPALVEQSIGRIIRQGNMYAGDADGKGRRDVIVRAWITRGTLEEYMWGLNATKAAWIRGFFAGVTDEMNGEIDDSGNEYALLSATTSADPRVQELATKQAELARMLMLERAHLDAQQSVFSQISGLRIALAAKKEFLEKAKTLPKAPDTRGDKFSMEIGGARFVERPAAGAALLAAARNVWDSDKDIGPLPIASFTPEYVLTASSIWSALSGKREWRMALTAKRGNTVQTLRDDRFDPAVRADGVSATGLLQSAEHWLRVRDNIEADAEREVTEHESALATAESKIEPWGRNEEVSKLRADVQALQAAVVASANAQAAQVNASNAAGQAGGAAGATPHVHEDRAEYGTAADDSSWRLDLHNTKMGLFPRGRSLRLGETPDVLQACGADALPLVISPDVVRKITSGAHAISWKELERLPGSLRDPIAVFRSKSNGDALVVMTEMKEGDKTVVVAVHLNRHEQRHEVNAIRSAYGKDQPGSFVQWARDGLMLYLNKQKVLAWSQSAGVQFPREATKQGPKTIDRVLNEADIVKRANALRESSAKYGFVEPAIRAQFPDPQGADATAAVREAFEQLELALSAPDTSYPPVRRNMMPPRRHFRDFEARREQVRRALAGHFEAATLDGVMPKREGMLDLRLSRILFDRPEEPRVLDVEQGYTVKSPRDVAAIFWPIRQPFFERFGVVALSSTGKVLSARIVTIGILDAAPVHPRQIFSGLPAGTKHIVLSHNHPSGDSAPSSDDMRVTRQLIDAGRILGINVLDHVTTNGEFRSMRNLGLVNFDPSSRTTSWLKRYMQSPGAEIGDLADWEIVPYADRPFIRDTVKVEHTVRPFVKHADDGHWVHVLMLDTRNRLTAVQRFSGDREPAELRRRIWRAVVGHGGNASIIIGFNWADPKVSALARGIYADSLVEGIRLLDAMDSEYISARELGAFGESALKLPGVWNVVPDKPAVGLAAERAAVAESKPLVPPPRGGVRESQLPYGLSQDRAESLRKEVHALSAQIDAAYRSGRLADASGLEERLEVMLDDLDNHLSEIEADASDDVADSLSKSPVEALAQVWDDVVVARRVALPEGVTLAEHIWQTLADRPGTGDGLRMYSDLQPRQILAAARDAWQARDRLFSRYNGPGMILREAPAPYGADSWTEGRDGPDWESYAQLAQQLKDLERHAGRRVEITRAIERDKMSRLSREMASLKRFRAKAVEARDANKAADKALAKTTSKEAFLKAFRQAFHADPSRTETLADLLREAASVGRNRATNIKSVRDLRGSIRDALNARVKRLMARGPMPTNWSEITVARNRAMLAQIDQIEAAIGAESLPPEAAKRAAAAEVLRLIGHDKDVAAALEGLGPGSTWNILHQIRAALDRDIKAHYRRELHRLFGGQATTRRLPDGRTVQAKTKGVIPPRLSQMTDAPRAAMQALVSRIDWGAISALNSDELAAIVDQAKQLLADDDDAKLEISEGHKERRAAIADLSAREIEAARPALAESARRDPSKGGFSQRSAWWRATIKTRALLLTGGDSRSVTYRVLGSALEEANARQLDIEAADNTELEALMKGLGFTRDDLLTMDFVLEKVPLANDTEVELTRGEMMTLYGMTLDDDAREKLVHNGWRPSRYRHAPGRTIRGAGENYEERIENSEAIIGSVIDRLTPREKRVVEWMVQEKSRHWAALANETSRRVSGVSLFHDRPHITLVGSVDRQAEIPNVDDPAGFRRHMVDRMGLTVERQSHTHPLLVRPLLSVFRLQSRDMSTYIAWAVPYRDAISLLSRGPAKGAIVERWGSSAIRDLKDSLAYLTYQKGHTDDFGGWQKFLQQVERRAAVFILGGRVSTIMFNRYGGGIMLAVRLAQDLGPKFVPRYLARLSVPPVLGMERSAVSPRRAAIRAKLMKSGYFWDRWFRHAFRVFGQLSSQRMELDEASAIASNAPGALLRRQRWQDFSTFMLSGMQHAEIANVIDMWEVLAGAGWDDARILKALERWTRETQNPSTPLENSGAYTDIRRSGTGVILPFLGQPTVQADQLLAQWELARRDKAWGKFAWYTAGVILSLLLVSMIRMLIRRASHDELLDPPDKDDGLALAIDLGMNASENFIPGASRVLEPLTRQTAATLMGQKKLLPRGVDDETLAGQVLSAYNGLGNSLSKWMIDGKVSEEQAERMLLDAHRLIGMVTPLPTGGVEQGARVAAGLMGEPIGVKPKEPTGRRLIPKPRRD